MEPARPEHGRGNKNAAIIDGKIDREAILYGITLKERPADWSVLQEQEGSAKAHLVGTFAVHPAALSVGVESVTPCYRLMNEEDNLPVIPWMPLEPFQIQDRDRFQGSFETDIDLPIGGPYRLETTLLTKSTRESTTWLYRGDTALHLLVGDLFVIAGQSNSAGHAWDYCPDPPHLCVHLLRNRGSWDLATHPLNESTDAGSLPNEEMGIPGISPYLAFGKKYYALTGHPVGLIQTALGGSTISQWNPDSGPLYRNMLERIRMSGQKPRGVLWYQGCNDTDNGEAPRYLTDFHYFVACLRRDLGYSIPIFTMQLNRQIESGSDIGWGLIREAQRRAAIEIPGIEIMTTTNLPLSDTLHNSAAGNVVLGQRLAMQVAKRLVGVRIPDFTPPQLCDADLLTEEMCQGRHLDGIWMELCFHHVHSWFILYSHSGEKSGFSLSDRDGEIPILKIRADVQDRNRMYLCLQRKPGKDAVLSFCWQADPVSQPPVDAVTYLPPVSFYRLHVPAHHCDNT